MLDQDQVIKGLDELEDYFYQIYRDSDDREEYSIAYDRMEVVECARDILKEHEAKPPIHVHEEYQEHDWKRRENGEIDDFAYDNDYHNGPMCKRCYYSFCMFCDPDGWNKEPCIIDKYKCPKCGRFISKGTKFCSDCGQEVKWND